VVEERQVAALHGALIVAGHGVAHAGPGLDAVRHLLVPGEGVRLGLDKPMGDSGGHSFSSGFAMVWRRRPVVRSAPRAEKIS